MFGNCALTFSMLSVSASTISRVPQARGGLCKIQCGPSGICTPCTSVPEWMPPSDIEPREDELARSFASSSASDSASMGAVAAALESPPLAGAAGGSKPSSASSLSALARALSLGFASSALDVATSVHGSSALALARERDAVGSSTLLAAEGVVGRDAVVPGVAHAPIKKGTEARAERRERDTRAPVLAHAARSRTQRCSSRQTRPFRRSGQGTMGVQFVNVIVVSTRKCDSVVWRSAWKIASGYVLPFWIASAAAF